MPVVIKYVVERNGVEKMTFSSKAEADHYDKLLETAESLEDLLLSSGVVDDEKLTAKLAMYLAKNKDDVLEAFGNKRKKTAKKSNNERSSKSGSKPESEVLEDLVIEPDETSYVDDNGDDYRASDDAIDYNKDEIYSDSDAA
ncbi:DNA damage-inducible protein YebG [Marinomonas gallaica]|uniref:DNA damage-inducible protein YebG n=1 Tax=Marinomonas gallaica TaxID=1806667 RepID=A0A1C3JNG7_9GAMM|nr:DNA damage-inducible protein YebG [Marinomonas gallaica]SBT20336.1 DNA damage-inducible protein YebG [Marinomonas gallaica]